MSGVNITGNKTSFGFEALNVAMTKRANDAQGQAAMQLLQGAVQSTQQIQQSSPVKAASGTLGANVDIHV